MVANLLAAVHGPGRACFGNKRVFVLVTRLFLGHFRGFNNRLVELFKTILTYETGVHHLRQKFLQPHKR